MPITSFHVSTDINVKADLVFAYIADLTRHGEWSANPIQINALSRGPIGVGSRYQSVAQVNGITLTAELQVIQYQSPTHFGFTGEYFTGKFEHHFILQPTSDGTHVERKISFALTKQQWVMFQIILYPVRLPAARKALGRLKKQLEQATLMR